MDTPQLQHPQEIPRYAICVVLNIVILVVLIVVALDVGQLPGFLGRFFEADIFILIIAIPSLVVGRQTLHAATLGSSIKLSRTQFPDIYESMEAFARELRLGLTPEIYVSNGNGVLNAFAASAQGIDFMVLHSDLFANTYEQNRRALLFILGHELGHLKLRHTHLLNQLSLAYVHWIPLVYPWLSRARELSSDRHGAYLEPNGADGLVLLAAGRYVYQQVNVRELLAQAATYRGFWMFLVEITRTHPGLMLRLRTLYALGFFRQPEEAGTLSPQTRPLRSRAAPLPDGR